MPNIGGAIKESKNLEMIKTLVSAGATLTNNVFERVADDYDAVKYLIDANMDVDFEAGLPLRTSAKKGRLDIMKLLLDNGAKINTRRFMVLKWAAELGNAEVLEYLLSRLDETGEKCGEKNIKDWLHWVKTTDKATEEAKQKTVKILENRLKSEGY
jgi:ankyrin repeat protein